MNSWRFFLVCSVVVGILGFSNGCKKDEVPPDPPPTGPTGSTGSTGATGPVIPFQDTLVDYFLSSDTVFPSDYLMWYPGSWWLYEDGTRDSAIAWKGFTVVQAESTAELLSIKRIRKIHPYTTFGVSAGDYLLTTNGSFRTTSRKQIVGGKVGEVIYHSNGSSGSGHDHSETNRSLTYIEHLDSLVVYGSTFYDVMVIEERHQIYFTHLMGGPVYYHRYYYSKEVGLVRKHRHYNNAGVVYDLVDFHIAPH